MTFHFYHMPKKTQGSNVLSSIASLLPAYAPFVVQYNPTTLNVTHDVKYDCKKRSTSGNSNPKFIHTNPRTVSMELLFDSTGASPSSIGSLATLAEQVGLKTNLDIKRVDVQVQLFMKLAYQISPDDHQPLGIMLSWGTFVLNCRLTSASVNYTMFASDGSPLRARVSVSVKEVIPDTLLQKILSLASPDLSKSVTVKEGDNLQLLCQQVYGNPALYTQVAAVNKLSNYRKLVPGTQLLFPPINASV